MRTVQDKTMPGYMEDGPVIYDKIPREVLITRVQENGLNMWRRQWTDMEKGAVTKLSPLREE